MVKLSHVSTEFCSQKWEAWTRWWKCVRVFAFQRVFHKEIIWCTCQPPTQPKTIFRSILSCRMTFRRSIRIFWRNRGIFIREATFSLHNKPLKLWNPQFKLSIQWKFLREGVGAVPELLSSAGGIFNEKFRILKFEARFVKALNLRPKINFQFMLWSHFALWFLI